MAFLKLLFIGFSVPIILLSCSNVSVDNKTAIKSTPVENKKEVFLNDDASYVWTSPGFPDPYPAENHTLVIKCDTGYSVSVTIEKLDLDGNSGDFLIIKPGTTLGDDSEGRVFTYMLKNNDTFVVHSNNVFLSLQVIGKNEIKKTGFSLSYKRVGELKLPSETITTTPWPTPSETDSSNLIVYVAGKTPLEFNTAKVQTDFQMAVSKMAINYCESNKIAVLKEITFKNVQIHYLAECPYSWPERDTCMKVYFAVPVYTTESPTYTTEYQLTTFHLNKMWNTLGNQFLQPYGMSIYEQPSNRSTLKWWIIVVCGTVVLFAILLYLLKVFATNIPNNYTLKQKKMNSSNALPIRSKILTMNPYTYSQSTPAIFGNEDYSYKKCEPDLPAPTHFGHSEMDHRFSDSDDDIIFPKLKKALPQSKDGTSRDSYS